MFALSAVCASLAITIHEVHAFRSFGLVLIMSAAGVPLPGVVHTRVLWLWWASHLLFWIPAISWLVPTLRRRLPRTAHRLRGGRGRVFGRRQHAVRRSGNPAVHSRAGQRDRR
jgi:hypothetical protein